MFSLYLAWRGQQKVAPVEAGTRQGHLRKGWKILAATGRLGSGDATGAGGSGQESGGA